ncbi:MAG: SDR family NAD(P)-dependent oxidoreductase [Alphaproteobacteria bacterium]|nr:SDR family NAD(P)-dependent oxidoreductase [Alphaproteobacteria bacterium]
MTRLADKRVLITGAGAGIGRAAALLFAANGARVAVLDVAEEAGAATAEAIRDADGEGLFVAADITQPDQVAAAVDRVADAFGGLDVLYNNAGGSTAADGKVTELPIEEWWRTIQVDLFGTFLGCRFAIPVIARSGGGSIINTTSVRAMIGTLGADAYTAAKGGVITLTKALALECAPARLRVNALAPGAVMTERAKGLFAQAEETGNDAIGARHLLGLGEPDDIARLALYLASDESRLMTGAIIPIDSGVSAT